MGGQHENRKMTDNSLPQEIESTNAHDVKDDQVISQCSYEFACFFVGGGLIKGASWSGTQNFFFQNT